MKCFNKRGISPLIATVLIIGFTVALSAVVMTWGTGFVRDTTTATAEQTNLALSCAKLNFQIDAKCTGNLVSEIEVSNNGDLQIRGWIFRIARAGGTTPIDVLGTAQTDPGFVSPFGVKKITITDSNPLDEVVESVGAIAKISDSAGNIVTCADTLIERANPCA